MTRDSFVGEIQLGKYPGYIVVEKMTRFTQFQKLMEIRKII